MTKDVSQNSQIEKHLDIEKRKKTALELIIPPDNREKFSNEMDRYDTWGIMAFGSFWTGDGKRVPRDIDLAIYCDNPALFDDSKPSFINYLQETFGLEVEIHSLTKYSSMVKGEKERYTEYLKDGFLVWGEMPSWVQIT